MLGQGGYRGRGMRHHHYTEEEMEDPEGWEWVQAPQDWIIVDDKNKS